MGWWRGDQTDQEDAITDEPTCSDVEYGGQCAFAVSLATTDEPESGQHRLVQDGRTFSFENAVAKFLFKSLNRTGKADQNWASRSA